VTVTEQVEPKPSVLVVDDEPDMRLLAKTLLQRGGLDVIGEAADGTQAMERFLALDPPPVPTVVVLDNRMPGLTGIEVAEQMLSRQPDQVIVLFSAHLDEATEEDARSKGIAACVSKVHVGRLSKVIWSLLPPT
jgi:two-component system chemotaxis response regulator CheY